MICASVTNDCHCIHISAAFIVPLSFPPGHPTDTFAATLAFANTWKPNSLTALGLTSRWHLFATERGLDSCLPGMRDSLFFLEDKAFMSRHLSWGTQICKTMPKLRLPRRSNWLASKSTKRSDSSLAPVPKLYFPLAKWSQQASELGHVENSSHS